jgi:hypothetical protein
MTNDLSDPKSNLQANIVDVFSRPPSPEEIDKRVISSPWILQNRLTYPAYATRCRLLGKEPNMAEWFDHLKLSTEELSLVDDLIEARREKHRFGLGPKFILREYGNKARIGWFDDRGELVTMSFGEFKNAHIEKRIEVQQGNQRKFLSLVDHWLQHPLSPRFDRVDYQLGVDQVDMLKPLAGMAIRIEARLGRGQIDCGWPGAGYKWPIRRAGNAPRLLRYIFEPYAEQHVRGRRRCFHISAGVDCGCILESRSVRNGGHSQWSPRFREDYLGGEHHGIFRRSCHNP